MSAYLRKGKKRVISGVPSCMEVSEGLLWWGLLMAIDNQKMFHVCERLATGLGDVSIVSWEWGALAQTV